MTTLPTFKTHSPLVSIRYDLVRGVRKADNYDTCAVKSYAKFSAAGIINGKQPSYYRSIVTSDNLNRQILRPDWLVYTISTRANVILQLYDVILEFCDSLYLNESAPQVLGSSVLEECRLEERIGIMLVK